MEVAHTREERGIWFADVPMRGQPLLDISGNRTVLLPISVASGLDSAVWGNSATYLAEEMNDIVVPLARPGPIVVC